MFAFLTLLVGIAVGWSVDAPKWFVDTKASVFEWFEGL